MPGLELFGSSEPVVPVSTVVEYPSSASSVSSDDMETDEIQKPGSYYNSRLDPKNFLEGPLSLNPATRLRQMLARPGIVVRSALDLMQLSRSKCANLLTTRLHPVSVTA